MNHFNFKRGDTVRMLLLENNNIVEHVGLVLEVTEDKIKTRRDSDGSTFDTNIDGKAFNLVDGGQFLQLQKVLNPENNYTGKRITSAIMNFGTENIEQESVSYLELRLYNNDTIIFEDKTYMGDYHEYLYADFHKNYEF